MSTKPTGPAAPEPEKEAAASILSDLQGTGGEQSVMPDLGGVNASSPGSKYKVHSQTLVIALVLAASGAALYLMRKQGMGGVPFTPPKIDYNMDKASTPADAAHQQQVLSDLETSQSPPQVAAEKVQKNPFQLDSHGPTMTAMTSDPDALQRAAQIAMQAARQQQVTTALANIEVNAIMQGNTPLARINAKIVREGDVIAEFFKVKEIHDRSVDLEADGKLYVVNMSENTTPGKPRVPSRASELMTGRVEEGETGGEVQYR